MYGKFKEAIPLLDKLIAMEPSNANLFYLKAVCYTSLEIELDQAIKLFNEARDRVSVSYDPGLPNENSAPVFLFYYQGIACALIDKCADAKLSFDLFRARLNPGEGESFLMEIERFIRTCNKKEVTGAEIKEIERPRKMRGILRTRKVEYSAKNPLYGVQIGAFKSEVPANDQFNLPNVISFMDHDSMIRFVIGNSAYRTIAESILKAVIDSGFKDAFIVDINKEKKFSEELIHESRSLKGSIKYAVQVGVFRDKITMKETKTYLKVPGIREVRDNKLIYLYSGNFNNYKNASEYKAELIKEKVPDAFVVAFLNGKRVSVSEINSQK